MADVGSRRCWRAIRGRWSTIPLATRSISQLPGVEYGGESLLRARLHDHHQLEQVTDAGGG